VFGHSAITPFLGRRRGYRDLEDYLVNCDDQKNEGPFGEFFFTKSRNSHNLNGRSCGCIGTEGAILRNPGTKYKRSNNVFAVTFVELIIGRDWSQLL